MASKSKDESQFTKSLIYHLPECFLWKPPDAGEPSENKRFELPRPSDFVIFWLSPEGPVGGLIELKRHAKGTLILNDLRPNQILSLRRVAANGNFAYVGVHQLVEGDPMVLVPFQDVDVTGRVLLKDYPRCPRGKFGKKSPWDGWDLSPLIDLMTAHAYKWHRRVINAAKD